MESIPYAMSSFYSITAFPLQSLLPLVSLAIRAHSAIDSGHLGTLPHRPIDPNAFSTESMRRPEEDEEVALRSNTNHNRGRLPYLSGARCEPDRGDADRRRERRDLPRLAARYTGSQEGAGGYRYLSGRRGNGSALWRQL